MGKIDLKQFNNDWYYPGAGGLKRLMWYITNALWFNSAFPIYGVKRFLLRLFGAKVGKGLIIKPHVNIKYPWRLTIGDHVWIGEGAWIDNMANVSIADNVCISQGAMLLCGNHNFKKPAFDLLIGDIVLEEGVWIGAKAIVCPNVTCRSHSILAVNSVAARDLEAYSFYQGNPATKTRERTVD